jgi:hypothetical protein
MTCSTCFGQAQGSQTFMLDWRNVNFIKPKWNSLPTSSLEMTFTWILARFRLLLIGLPQFLFVIFNVLLDLLTSIDNSLHNILQEWFFLLI